MTTAEITELELFFKTFCHTISLYPRKCEKCNFVGRTPAGTEVCAHPMNPSYKQKEVQNVNRQV